MPRFHFHIFDGRDQPDEDGTELPDFETARLEAIRYAGEVLRDQADRVALGEHWRMDVTDESGLVLLRLDFSALAEPAAPHSSAWKPKFVA